MKTRTLRKALSMLLTAAMALNMGLTPVFATKTALPSPPDSSSEGGEIVTTPNLPELPAEDGKPAEKVCTCPPVDSGEPVHGKDCPASIVKTDVRKEITLTAQVKYAPTSRASLQENGNRVKVYDGTTNFTNVELVLEGIESNPDGVLDDVTATADGYAASKDVGDHAFTATSVTLGGVDAGWYDPPALDSITGTVVITARNPTYSVTDQSIKIGKTLGGIQAAPTATGVNSEAVAGTLKWSETDGGAALTDYTFTGAAGSIKELFWTFAPNSGNYTELSGSTTFTLTAKEVPALTVSDIEKNYDGIAITTVTGTAKVGETTVAGDFAFDDGAPTMQNASTYIVTVKFTPTNIADYETATTSITVTIKKAEVTVKAEDKTIIVGESVPSFTIAYSGFIGTENDGNAALDTPAVASCTADGKTAGIFDITIGTPAVLNGTVGKNYTIISQTGGKLTVRENLFTLTMTGGGGGAYGGGSYAPGTSVSINAGSYSGHSFSGWSSSNGGTFANANIASTTFTMPGNDVTITANWTRNSGSTGGGNSDGGTTTPPSGNNQENTTPPTNAEVKVPAEVDKNGNATVTVNDKNITDTIKKAQDEAKKNGTEKNGIAVTITLDSNKTINSFTANLPKLTQEKLIAAGVTTLTIDGGATIAFDLAAIKQIKATANTDVAVTATKTANSALSKEAQAATSGRPVYDFKVTGGGKIITTFGNGKLSLSIPYEQQKVDGNGKLSKTGSFEDPGNLVGVYIDANGKLTYLPGSSYNARGKTMLISTTHLSVYGVAYKQNAPTFTDTATHWAKDDIQFVAARGLLTGTTATTFSPNTSMTRGMLATALTTLSGKDMTAVVGGNMTDMVTREGMAVIMQNYAKAIGYNLPSVHKEIIFTDSASIGAWAKSAVKEMQMAGILQGRDGGKFDPTGTATRAEVSAMLRRFVELVANSETAEGWVQNDSGNWMYFEDGKAVTGKKKIDGTTYEFDKYGMTAILPKDRRFTLYTVQKGDSFWAIASKHKVNIFELVSLNGKNIFSTIHPGDELKIPRK